MAKKRVFVLAGIAVLIIAAASAILLALLRQRDFSRLRGKKDFNVILITVDTLRADRIGCYGFSRIETPTMDHFASRGVKFENCIAQTPLTLPSHASLFTGTLPLFHRVRDNGGFVVPAKMKTLAEAFREKGYSTAAFVGAYVLDSKWGLNQGFDTYFDDFDLSKFEKISLGSIQRPANEVMDEALKWLDEKRDKKFFAWIHLYDPHSPYQPPPPFDTQYPGNPYLGEIAFTDTQLARLWKFLEEGRLLEHSFLVFASDHGESLGEHQEAGHGFFVYQAAVHVPLIFVTPFPGLHGLSASPVISLVDVMPTVLEMSGFPVPEEVQGTSLLPLFFSPKKKKDGYAYSETFYPRFHYGWSELKCFVGQKYKLIIAPEMELYDLARDRGESQNLASSQAALLAELNSAATQFIDTYSQNAYLLENQKIDEETREKLAALGYIGSFTDSAKLEGKKLASPKEKIKIFNALSLAREIGMSGKTEEAVSIIKGIIAEDPEINDAYFSLGNIYFKAGKFEDAIAFFQQALERKPDDAFCVMNIANSYQRLGKFDQAEKIVLNYLKSGFSDAQLYYLLGTLSSVQNKYDEAIRYYNQCLSLNSESAASHNALGAIYIVKDNLAQAENHLSQAMALNPKLSNLQYNRAELLEKQGKIQEAEDAYLLELENSSRHFKASFNLSRIYRITGRQEEERRYLEKTIAINPVFPLSYFYLARILLSRGENYEEAIRLTKKGIELRPEPKDLPLGYFLLADLYNRLGDNALSAEYARQGRELARANTPSR